MATEVARPPPPDTRFKPGHERKGGRAPGTPNHFSLNTREAIVIALNNLGGGGQDGLINWIEGAVKEDTSFGIKLLTAIVPRQADIHVTRTAPEIRTIEDLDRSLVAAGLPPMREVFALDYSSDADTEVTESKADEVTAKK